LKNGVILCKLANAIQADAIKTINKPGMPFSEMENVGMFLKWAKSLGIADHDLFQTVDLYKANNIQQVIQCLDSIGRKVNTIDSYKGPKWNAPKESEKTTRDFSEASQREARSQLPLMDKGAVDASKTAGTTTTTVRDVVTKADHTHSFKPT